jgi:hypothetical protein
MSKMVPYGGVIYHVTQLDRRRNDAQSPATCICYCCGIWSPGIASWQAFFTYASGKGPLGLVILEVMPRHCLVREAFFYKPTGDVTIMWPCVILVQALRHLAIVGQYILICTSMTTLLLALTMCPFDVRCFDETAGHPRFCTYIFAKPSRIRK